MLLPIISEETLHSTLATLQDQPGYSKMSIEQMKQDNPVLYSLMETIASSNKDDLFIRGYVVGAAQFYTLLT